MPATRPVAKPSRASSLRRIAALLVLVRPARPLRRRLRCVSAVVDAAQAALQVVEDEADGRVGPGRGHDAAGAVADDEHAAVERRRLELRQRTLARAEALSRLEQLARGAY